MVIISYKFTLATIYYENNVIQFSIVIPTMKFSLTEWYFILLRNGYLFCDFIKIAIKKVIFLVSKGMKIQI